MPFIHNRQQGILAVGVLGAIPLSTEYKASVIVNQTYAGHTMAVEVELSEVKDLFKSLMIGVQGHVF